VSKINPQVGEKWLDSEGREIRIICTDRGGDWPIVGLGRIPGHINEATFAYKDSGVGPYGGAALVKKIVPMTKVRIILYRYADELSVASYSVPEGKSDYTKDASRMFGSTFTIVSDTIVEVPLE
jgi:hypothetical protein